MLVSLQVPRMTTLTTKAISDKRRDQKSRLPDNQVDDDGTEYYRCRNVLQDCFWLLNRCPSQIVFCEIHSALVVFYQISNVFMSVSVLLGNCMHLHFYVHLLKLTFVGEGGGRGSVTLIFMEQIFFFQVLAM